MSDQRSFTGTEVAKRLTDRADAHDRMAAGSGAQHIGFYSSCDAQLMRDAARRIEQLEAALRVFAADESWRRDGRCDPNSGNFDGQTIARAALAPEQDK